jgi:hypothetical protein
MKAFICIFVIVASIALQDRADAGWKSPSPASVWIVDGAPSSYASGDLAAVRASANSIENIGCLTSSYPDAFTWVGCQARNATGTSRMCWTNDPNLADAVAGMSDAGQLFFMWDASGTCTYIEVVKNSGYGPRMP